MSVRTDVFATFPFDRSPEDPVRIQDEYAQARGLEQPLVKIKMWNGTEAWLATRYKDVVALLTDNRFSALPSRPGYPSPTESRAILLNSEPPALGQIDIPDHTRYRRMFASMFGPKQMRDFRPQIQQIVDDSIDHLLAQGKGADFCQAFAYRIPTTAVAIVMGVPPEDRDFFLECANARFFHTTDPAAAVEAGVKLGDYFERLLAEREADPQETTDVVTRIVNEQIIPGNMTRDDAVVFLRNILVNGQDTAANTMSLAVVTFARFPEQLEKLKQDPSKADAAIAELLRFLPGAHFNAPRTALEDIEYQGMTIAEGEGIIASLPAGDHDPAEFPDPETFDIDRPNLRKHLGFGAGIHRCLGEHLAKLEIEIALNTLYARIPTLTIAVPYEQLRFTNNTGQAFGVHEVPVTW